MKVKATIHLQHKSFVVLGPMEAIININPEDMRAAEQEAQDLERALEKTEWDRLHPKT